jgi:hypothetical protein
MYRDEEEALRFALEEERKKVRELEEENDKLKNKPKKIKTIEPIKKPEDSLLVTIISAFASALIYYEDLI